MIRKIRSAFALIKNGKIKNFFEIIYASLQKCFYLVRARIEDWRLGGVSLERTIPSKYIGLGSKATQSTNYRMLDRAFKDYSLKENDVLMDVGCGEGRVLTYLYLRGYRNKMIGVELDQDVAKTAKARTIKCENIEILCSNILECSDIIKQSTVFYLFNPFNDTVLKSFIQLIEEHCNHDVVVYYIVDVHRDVIDKRSGWEVFRRHIVRIPRGVSYRYSIYKYSPRRKK